MPGQCQAQMSHCGEGAEVGRGRNAAARLVDGMGRRGPSPASARCEDTKSLVFFLFCAGHGSPGRLHYGLHGGCVQQRKNLQLQSTGSCKTEKKERKRLRKKRQNLQCPQFYSVTASIHLKTWKKFFWGWAMWLLPSRPAGRFKNAAHKCSIAPRLLLF